MHALKTMLDPTRPARRRSHLAHVPARDQRADEQQTLIDQQCDGEGGIVARRTARGACVRVGNGADIGRHLCAGGTMERRGYMGKRKKGSGERQETYENMDCMQFSQKGSIQRRIETQTQKTYNL
jgi:hypothetical protein